MPVQIKGTGPLGGSPVTTIIVLDCSQTEYNELNKYSSIDNGQENLH